MEAWTNERAEQIIDRHKQFYASGQTRGVSFRLQQLKKLQEAIKRYEQQLMTALYQDLRKSEFESYATEIGLVLGSIRHMMKHLKRWMRPLRVKSPIHVFPSRSYIRKEAYGTVLIIGPFNYPVQLVLEPLIGAIAAGNCAVIKPSESCPNVSAVIRQMIGDIFEESYIEVIEGEKEATTYLINAPFDYIFFTGSVAVGKIVMEAAAKNLVPVTLELGGKSPVIVDQTANLDIAAKRIIWGKLLNAGQTCIAPDYLLVHEDIKAALMLRMKEAIDSFYGYDASKSNDYGRIVNKRQFSRLQSILEQDRAKISAGGASKIDDLFIEPTLIDNVSWEDASMSEEIFGPILPIMSYKELNHAIQMINNRPKPLALYIFTENKAAEKEVLERVSFGGGCVNDTLSHVASVHLPFGGVGSSGIGAYHGKSSFDVFSHQKSIVKRSTKLDLGFAYPPYTADMKWLKKWMK
ncbi:aldehyde dehydrogenase (NAD+) [Paenibacillus castaneae]|uniref:aldehyde dehydrogenase n=1 Tax=Paenibacillus castaneae TaxID=474957 RepID=UPI000C9C8AD8|nr:aldehyde dehydrogenase [Paenibacillus castaneae]NIK78961.1 aldehyde dehydrogenase (NAD+) [Paenibacillus castaneae]